MKFFLISFNCMDRVAFGAILPKTLISRALIDIKGVSKCFFNIHIKGETLSLFFFRGGGSTSVTINT